MYRRSIIKRIQRGVTSGATPFTLPFAVVMANSRLRYLGRYTNNDAMDMDFVRLVFTNPTTITPVVQTAGGLNGVSFEVIEYVPGIIKSMQRDTMGANTTKAITAVDVDKTELDLLGNTTTSNNTGDNATSHIKLLNPTTIESSPAGGWTITLGFQVAEFY